MANGAPLARLMAALSKMWSMWPWLLATRWIRSSQVGDPRNERRRSAHAGIEDQRILRMAVLRKVGVRLPRAERSNPDPDAVRRVGSHPIALDDGLLGHDSADARRAASFSPKARARSAARTSATSVS